MDNLLRKTLFAISILFILIFNSNISNWLGYGDSVTTVAFMPFVLLFIVYIIQRKVNLRSNISKYAIVIFFIGFVCLLFKITLHQNMFKDILLFYFFPAMMLLIFENMSENERNILKLSVFILLTIEILLAIYERATYSVIFASEDTYALMNMAGDTWSFRASALYGHPLLNAMITMTICLFVISSNDIKLSVKLIVLFFSIIGLFCFNERGNILITICCSVPIIFRNISTSQKRTKRIAICLLSIFIIILIYLLNNSELGGRLLHLENSFTANDGSMKARFTAFSALSLIPTKDLIWGNPQNYNNLLFIMGQAGIENGPISFILKYGLVFGLITLFALFILQCALLKRYHLLDRFLIMLAFYAIAFTNPHITNSVPWIIFYCSCYAFNKPNSKGSAIYKYQIKSKYNEKNCIDNHFGQY